MQSDTVVEDTTILGKRKETNADVDPLVCPVCQKVFKTARNVTIHQSVHTKERPFKCESDGCGKAFGSLSVLCSHRKTHTGEKEHGCETCGKEFAQAGNLKRHQLVHMNERLFECDICHKAFKNELAVTSHKLIHSESKEFVCSLCQKEFRHQYSLKLHERTHSGVKPYICSQCSRAFSFQNNLKRHIRTHTGERPHECSLCEKKFITSSELKIHMRTHTGERPFQCETCEATFTNRTALSYHQTVHGVKTFVCPHPPCDQKYGRADHLQSHIQCWHSSEGMRRKKRQEHRLKEFLKGKFILDEELVINYQNDCVVDPDRFRARIDFHIPEITQAVCILECDERSHQGYPVSCEVSRMDQIHEALLKGGIAKPVLFIRYNSNGKVYKKGAKGSTPTIEREAALLKLLTDLRDGTIGLNQEKPLHVIYLYYPSSQDGIPKVCLDPDYSDQMYACVDLSLCS